MSKIRQLHEWLEELSLDNNNIYWWRSRQRYFKWLSLEHCSKVVNEM